MKILVAEDEVVSRIKLVTILESLGRIEAVDNGRDAVTLFRKAWEEEEPFDLVCLDVSMPGLDGTEVLLEIREIESSLKVTREKPAKILMITSHTDKDTIITSIQAGCDDYLIKPFQSDKVLDKVRRLGLKVTN
ncbi:MAG: response regulator [Thermodesulfobacteriota bacterium]